MEIRHKKHNDVIILELDGRLDSNTLKEIEDTLPHLIEIGEKNILIDFSQLDYINSAGLRVLILAGKKLRKTGGRIVLCAMQDYIREVFDISGFSNFFAIYPTQQEALRTFN